MRSTLLFAPGLFFVLFGMLFLLAPSLVRYLLAFFVLFIGGLFLVGAWQLVRLKRRLHAVVRQSQVIIRHEPLDDKVLFH